MRIERGPDPGPFTNPSDYKRKYKPFLRSLFHRRCAYCHLPDHRSQGEEGATVDHFKPECRYPELQFNWSNLYYACHICNTHYKKHYPTPSEESEGKRLVDPCAEDPDDHFRLTWDKQTGCFSRVRHLTSAAEYAVFRLKLNDRPSLRDYWREIDHEERRLKKRLGEIEECLCICVEVTGKLSDSTIESLRLDYESQRDMCLQEMDGIRARRPFPND